ncbi:MAG TPA: DNRLRE domain-containing protein [Tepidisphaeraceae bacterium]|nr:DNRLRE domain-containing protein [Tepidisphaeraceae bacterium]
MTMAKRSDRSWFALVAVAGVVSCAGTPAGAATVVLSPSQDNALIQEPDGLLSDGAGPHFYVGRTTQTEAFRLRRGLIAFDVSTIPAGATIDSVTLALSMSRTVETFVPVDRAIAMHRVLASWGEGASNSGTPGGGGAPAQTGDATWLHRTYSGALWSAPGGDFNPTASATTLVGLIGSYSWTSAQLASDVQGWLAAPGTNFGWELIGDESTNGTARRFDSRTNPEIGARPTLTVTYSVPEPGGLGMVIVGTYVWCRRRRGR